MNSLIKVYFLVSKKANLLGFETCGFFSGEEGREKVFQRAKKFSIGEIPMEDDEPYYIESIDEENEDEEAEDFE